MKCILITLAVVIGVVLLTVVWFWWGLLSGPQYKDEDLFDDLWKGDRLGEQSISQEDSKRDD